MVKNEWQNKDNLIEMDTLLRLDYDNMIKTQRIHSQTSFKESKYATGGVGHRSMKKQKFEI